MRDYISSEDFDLMTEEEFLKEMELIKLGREEWENSFMEEIYRSKILEKPKKRSKFVHYGRTIKKPRFVWANNPTIGKNNGTRNSPRGPIHNRKHPRGNMPQLPYQISQIRRSVFNAKEEGLPF